MASPTIAAHSRHEPKKPPSADFFATFGNTKSLSTANSDREGVFRSVASAPELSSDHPDSTVIFRPWTPWRMTAPSGKGLGSPFRARAGHDCTMLPGFRLFAIMVAAAASLLVFGLGAAGILRATHQEFAVTPLRNLQTPPSNFVAEIPTLAVLQVEPPAVETSVPEQPEPAPLPAHAPAPLAEADTAPPDEEVVLPLVIIPDPPPFSITDATAVASLEAVQPQPAAKPTMAPASAISIRSVARKRAAMRAKARARLAHHHYRRRAVPPPPPQPPQRGLFSLFNPAPDPATTPAASTVASTLPPRR
jgi:hypothetical protein